MKTFALSLLLATLMAAPLEAAHAGTAKAPEAASLLSAARPFFFAGKSAEKRRQLKRKQTMRRRKRMYSF